MSDRKQSKLDSDLVKFGVRPSAAAPKRQGWLSLVTRVLPYAVLAVLVLVLALWVSGLNKQVSELEAGIDGGSAQPIPAAIAGGGQETQPPTTPDIATATPTEESVGLTSFTLLTEDTIDLPADGSAQQDIEVAVQLSSQDQGWSVHFETIPPDAGSFLAETVELGFDDTGAATASTTYTAGTTFAGDAEIHVILRKQAGDGYEIKGEKTIRLHLEQEPLNLAWYLDGREITEDTIYLSRGVTSPAVTFRLTRTDEDAVKGTYTLQVNKPSSDDLTPPTEILIPPGEEGHIELAVAAGDITVTLPNGTTATRHVALTSAAEAITAALDEPLAGLAVCGGDGELTDTLTLTIDVTRVMGENEPDTHPLLISYTVVAGDDTNAALFKIGEELWYPNTTRLIHAQLLPDGEETGADAGESASSKFRAAVSLHDGDWDAPSDIALANQLELSAASAGLARFEITDGVIGSSAAVSGDEVADSDEAADGDEAADSDEQPIVVPVGLRRVRLDHDNDDDNEIPIETDAGVAYRTDGGRGNKPLLANYDEAIIYTQSDAAAEAIRVLIPFWVRDVYLTNIDAAAHSAALRPTSEDEGFTDRVPVTSSLDWLDRALLPAQGIGNVRAAENQYTDIFPLIPTAEDNTIPVIYLEQTAHPTNDQGTLMHRVYIMGSAPQGSLSNWPDTCSPPE